jgi:hypothetical protein
MNHYFPQVVLRLGGLLQSFVKRGRAELPSPHQAKQEIPLYLLGQKLFPVEVKSGPTG